MHLLPGKTPLQKLTTFVATGFGIGVIAPFASGTWGSAPGVALAYATTLLPWWWQVAVCLALAAAAVPVCDVAEKVFDRKDDGRIVADEWMLLPICFAGQLPLWEMFGSGQWRQALAFTALAFVVSRVFDIVKIFPAYRLQSLHGGFGIVLDDFFADIYSWFAIRALALWLFPQFVIHFA